MIRAFRRWGSLLVLGSAVAGCTPRSMVQQKPPPPDPLLVTKKPIEGKPQSNEMDLSARLQPPAPPSLESQVASDPSHNGSSAVRPADLRLGAPTAP